MSKQPIVTRYKALVEKLLPQQDDLLEIAEELEAKHGTESVTPDQIDEATFHESEYLGGMAAALLAMMYAEDKA